MPLPPAIEFLAAQRDEHGNVLCQFSITQLDVLIPAGQTVRFTMRPAPGYYMIYMFRFMLDPSIVPGVLRANIYQMGGVPFSAGLYPGSQDKYIDTFERVTAAAPIVDELINLSALAQRYVSYGQALAVTSEENYLELERRLERYFGQRERVVERVERVTEVPAPRVPPAPPAPTPTPPPTPAPAPFPRRVT